MLEKITQQTFRASEIVNNLLNFSRTSGTEFGDVDVNKVIHDTLALLEHQFKTAQIRVEDELDAALPPIHGNAGKLQQVFLNLFLNAKDAMPDGGTLHVTHHERRRRERTRVTTPAPASLRNTSIAFTIRSSPPRRAPSSGQRRGTGLGLAVTYGIIQEHAGKIRRGEPPGEGTTFLLEFPMLEKAVNV